MINSALQLAKSIVHGNINFIEGNIAEYLIQDIKSDESYLYNFLTDNEIEEINGNPEKHKELIEDVLQMITDNFNFDISRLQY